MDPVVCHRLLSAGRHESSALFEVTSKGRAVEWAGVGARRVRPGDQTARPGLQFATPGGGSVGGMHGMRAGATIRGQAARSGPGGRGARRSHEAPSSTGTAPSRFTNRFSSSCVSRSVARHRSASNTCSSTDPVRWKRLNACRLAIGNSTVRMNSPSSFWARMASRRSVAPSGVRPADEDRAGVAAPVAVGEGLGLDQIHLVEDHQGRLLARARCPAARGSPSRSADPGPRCRRRPRAPAGRPRAPPAGWRGSSRPDGAAGARMKPTVSVSRKRRRSSASTRRVVASSVAKSWSCT